MDCLSWGLLTWIGYGLLIAQPIAAGCDFVAQLKILRMPENDIFTAGCMALLHIHYVIEECEIIELLQQIDPKTRKPMQKKVLFVNNGGIVLCRIQVKAPICIEKFSDFPLLGRFTLRAAGNKAFAVGKVLDFASTSDSSSSDLA